MASKAINSPDVETKTARFCYIDLGWNGIVSGGNGNTGKSKIAVKSGLVATLVGSTDITDEVSEGSTKVGRWRSGQIKVAAMDTLPFQVMLAGKVDNGGDTLTCKGFAGASVTVAYEI
jgi:hypothetical protein